MNRPADSLEAIVAEMRKRSEFLCEFANDYLNVEGDNLEKWADRLAALTPQPPAVLERPARVAGRDFLPGELVQQVIGRAHAHYNVYHGHEGTPNITPTPAAVPDAVRGLPKSWREFSGSVEDQGDGIAASYIRDCADELEQALSAAPERHSKQCASNYTRFSDPPQPYPCDCKAMKADAADVLREMLDESERACASLDGPSMCITCQVRRGVIADAVAAISAKQDG